MPAGRILLKSISESKKLSRLKTDSARLLYTWLIPHLDINGCFSGDAQVIKGKVLTRLKKTTKTVESYLEDLEGSGLIIRYEDNGDSFLHVPDFSDKQPSLNPKREAEPSIPMPTPDKLRISSDTSKVKESKVKESKVKADAEKEIQKHFDAFWDVYPRKIAKKVAFTAFKILLKTEAIDKIASATNGYNDYLKEKRLAEGKTINDQIEFILHPATFLRSDRWKDYVDFQYKAKL